MVLKKMTGKENRGDALPGPRGDYTVLRLPHYGKTTNPFSTSP